MSTVDPLREALREIAEMPTVQLNPDGDDQAAWTMQLIAREALAAAPVEVEYQYQAVAEWSDFKGTYYSASTLANAQSHVPELQQEFGDAEVYVERRIKAGPWERVTDA